jgi:hypothetical protein
MKRMSAELCRRSSPTGGLNFPTVSVAPGLNRATTYASTIAVRPLAKSGMNLKS